MPVVVKTREYGSAESYKDFGSNEADNKKKTKKDIELTLNYKDGVGAISGLKRISKPGQRIYLPLTKIKKVREGFGISIVSTSKGIMTDKEARKQKLGGEIICEIW